MEGTQDLWSFERPYTKANGKSQFRIIAETGEVIATGYCKRDENAKLMASAPALRAERDALREALTKAVEVIEKHVDINALGVDPQEGWPHRDMYLHHMRTALSQ